MANPTAPVALVTGGAKRVGRAIVEKLAETGHDIAFTYCNSEADAADLLKWISAKPARSAIAIKADLTDPANSVDHIAREFHKKFNRLDLLVHSASIYEKSSLDTTDLAQMRRLMAIHFESPLLLARALAGKLRESRGHVINMVDLLAERPWPQFLAYCASKAALANLTLGLARELAPQVTVNGIAPGVVEWPPGYPEDEKRKYLSRVPLARAGTPQDVASLVHFLATEGDYITGQIIRLDGGRSIT
jgi:pteridine reductase